MRIATIIYHLAITCWLGGATLFTFVLTPTLFKSYSRDMAGGIVGVLFPGYFQWGLSCGATALICLFLTRDRLALTAGGILAIMLTITATQSLVIAPRAAELKKQIPSFETTPADHPLRVQFRKLHGVSAAANLVVICGGVVLIILSSIPAQKSGACK
jgi:uncharacterized membrane protein